MAELFKIKDSNTDLRKADSLVSNKPISTTYIIGSIAHSVQIPAEINATKR